MSTADETRVMIRAADDRLWLASVELMAKLGEALRAFVEFHHVTSGKEENWAFFSACQRITRP